jgi:anti-sigma regulatory factor (Ser/Thr protein kinase)
MLNAGVDGVSAMRVHEVATTLPRAAEAAGHARAFTAKALAAWGMAAELTDDILLACSELVTNAIEHGTGVITLVLRHDGPLVELRVGDEGGGTPEAHPFGPRSARSRGLAIVQALSAEWGWSPGETGKSVWARFQVSR